MIRITRSFLIALIPLFAAAVPTTPAAAQGAQLPLSVELRVPKPPSVGAGEAGPFLVYELHVTNMGAAPLTLKRVEVMTADASPHMLAAISDRVSREQVLGLVGNSGNSTEPHLHLHVSDANSPLGSEGVPYVYDRYERLGACRGTLVGCTVGTPQMRTRQIPLENGIVRYP